MKRKEVVRVLRRDFPELSLTEHIDRALTGYLVRLIMHRAMMYSLPVKSCPGCGTHEKIITRTDQSRFCTTCQKEVV